MHNLGLVHTINEPKQWNSLITHSSVLLMCGWWGSFVSSLNANAILMIKTIVYCLSKQKQNENRKIIIIVYRYICQPNIYSAWIQTIHFVNWKRCDLKPISISIGFQIICFFSSQSRTKCGMFQVNQHNMKWYAFNTASRPEQFWFNSEKPTTYDHLKLGSLSCVKQTSFLLSFLLLLAITLE